MGVGHGYGWEYGDRVEVGVEDRVEVGVGNTSLFWDWVSKIEVPGWV